MVNFKQFGKALDAAKSLAEQHGDKLTAGIDKSVAAVDKATGGKHSDKLAEGGAKLKDAAGRLSKDDAARGADTGAAPATPQSPGPAGSAAEAPVKDPDAPKDAS